MRRLLLILLATVGLCVKLSAQIDSDSVPRASNRSLRVDSIMRISEKSTRKVVKQAWLPDPQKSLWFAILLPGAGQVYNRSYWKLPIVIGGAVGLTYGIIWENRYYNEYTQAYRDIMDSDPNTRSYENLLPYGVDENSSQAQQFLKSRHNNYRRNRDLCIVGAVAFYALTIIDAYVDAQLSDFDISPDLSMKVRPTFLVSETEQKPSVGVGVGFRF